MELIDKAAVVAEIKRRINELKGNVYEFGTHESHECGAFHDICLYEDIRSFLDTIEVKEVDLEDGYMVDRETAREKSILDETKVEYFATGNPTIAAYSEDNLRNQFDAGADWMKEQIIKALKEK